MARRAGIDGINRRTAHAGAVDTSAGSARARSEFLNVDLCGQRDAGSGLAVPELVIDVDHSQVDRA